MNRTMTKRLFNGNHGLSLLELMLAVSILSAAMVGIIHANMRIDRARLSAIRHSQALLLADKKLFEIKQDNNVFRNSDGVFEAPFEDFQWSIVQERESEFGYKEVHITIVWTEWQRPKSLSFSTLIRAKNDQQS